MFMPLISQIPFSPEELKPECSGMEIVNYIEGDLPALDSVLKKQMLIAGRKPCVGSLLKMPGA